MFKLLKVDIVCKSTSRAFSLSEPMFLGPLQILGLHSNSVGVGSHAPESDVEPESLTFLGERESTLFLG